jgi:hypothetical protein
MSLPLNLKRSMSILPVSEFNITSSLLCNVLILGSPLSISSWRLTVTSLKDKGMEYSSKLRANKIQGCFYFVRAYNELDDDLEADLINQESPLDANIPKRQDMPIKEVKCNMEILEQNNELITQVITLQDNEMKNLMKIQELEMMIRELKKQVNTPLLSEKDIDLITNQLIF